MKIRNPKSETNSKFKNAGNVQNTNASRFETFEFRIWNLFRFSDFGFAIVLPLP